MEPLFQVDHVAYLVKSLERAIEPFRDANIPIGPVQDFPDDGTREIYVGTDGPVRVLLIEAIGEGPYQRALEKRGPGLHHVCILAPDAKALAAGLEGTAWLLHSATLTSMPKTAWLCRSGIPFLIEAHFGKPNKNGAGLVERIELPFDGEHLNTVGLLFGGFLRRSTAGSRVIIKGSPISVV